MSGSAGGRAEQDLPRRAPHRAADPTSWLTAHRRLARDYEHREHFAGDEVTDQETEVLMVLFEQGPAHRISFDRDLIEYT